MQQLVRSNNIKKTSKIDHYWPRERGNPPVTGRFSSQRADNSETFWSPCWCCKIINCLIWITVVCIYIYMYIWNYLPNHISLYLNQFVFHAVTLIMYDVQLLPKLNDIFSALCVNISLMIVILKRIHKSQPNDFSVTIILKYKADHPGFTLIVPDTKNQKVINLRTYRHWWPRKLS